LPQSAGWPLGQMKTILIADDSASMRKLLETILKSEGHTILIAEDGREALKLAFDNEIDAIIADQEMPNLTGSEVFKILNTDPEKRSIPRILISGLTATDDKPASELFDVFVSKNADLKTELLAALDKLL
jgi:CheY-like chemotaxis protein